MAHIEIRVASTANAVGGVPIRRWREIWNFSLDESERLVVTDRLLKLPLRYDPPRVFGAFTLDEGRLVFRPSLDGFERICGRGDRIVLPNGVTMEIICAPGKGTTVVRVGGNVRPTLHRDAVLEIRIEKSGILEKPPTNGFALPPGKSTGPLFEIPSLALAEDLPKDDFMRSRSEPTVFTRRPSDLRPRPPALRRRRPSIRTSTLLVGIVVIWWVSRIV